MKQMKYEKCNQRHIDRYRGTTFEIQTSFTGSQYHAVFIRWSNIFKLFGS